MRIASGRIADAEQAAARATELAWQAQRAGTFGVGGFLMRQDGSIVADAVNMVIDRDEVRDPTAHVERQLIDWFLDARAHGKTRDAPQDLTIVSSLDPCAMCAAAILSVGMKAVAVAEDPASGVHSCGHPHRVPQALRARAEASLSLFRSPLRRAAEELHTPVLKASISNDQLESAQSAFSESLAGVRRTIASVDGSEPFPLDRVRGDRSLARALAPTIELVPGAIGALNSSGPPHSVLIGPNGEMLLGATAGEGPTRSSIVELVRGYAQVRRYCREVHALRLPHPRACAIVRLGESLETDSAMMALGALGSSLEDRPLPNRLPVLGVGRAQDAVALNEILAAMPPLYNDVLGMTIATVEILGGHVRRSGLDAPQKVS